MTKSKKSSIIFIVCIILVIGLFGYYIIQERNYIGTWEGKYGEETIFFPGHTGLYNDHYCHWDYLPLHNCIEISYSASGSMIYRSATIKNGQLNIYSELATTTTFEKAK